MKRKVIISLFILFTAISLVSIFSRAPSENRSKDVELWPAIQPYDTGYLPVSELHTIYYEQSGNPKGEPVFMVHGGPGGGSAPAMRRFFNPKKFRIILFDQRGAGKSKPFAEIKENRSDLLVEDMEKLRKHLDLDKVFLLGGSWGSTLSLLYAETYPQNVSGMLLRGIWTATREEIDHFYHGGAEKYFPDAYNRLIHSLPDPGQRPLPDYLTELLLTGDREKQAHYANEWARYEMKISDINASDEAIEQTIRSSDVYAFALLENYYMANQCFLEENQLLKNTGRIKDIPCTIVNGRYDMCCPLITAYKLHQALPGSKLVIVEEGGHGGWPVIKTTIREMRTFE